jgi:gliding motility-associated-like protein
MNKRLKYIFFFFLPALFLKISEPSAFGCTNPLLPPELRCDSVLANGTVAISWEEVLDTAGIFNSYHIFSATNPAGPFTEIDSIFNIAQTTYTDITANANLKITYYYIETRSRCNGMVYSNPSDTLQTMLLSAVNTTFGTAALTWNPVHIPDLSSSLGWYHVYREYPPGVWTMIDSTQSLNFIDTITVCHAHINYYVDIDNSLPCTSASSISGDLFEDIIPPVFPVIDSVSVDPATGHSVIGWTASPSGDTKGYIIYENENGIWVPIDTVIGRNNTIFENNLPSWSDPDSGSLSYCIAAFDSCKNTSRLDDNQNTIYLTSVFDICGRNVTLNWTPYLSMPSGLKGYNVYVSINNGPLTFLAYTPPGNTTFTQGQLADNSTYIYYVQAYNNTGTITSTSNIDTVFAYAPSQPKFVYLRYATVVNSDYVGITALIDTSGFSSGCKILRADDSTSAFNYIGTALPASHSGLVSYNDHTAQVNTQSYFYKVIALDSCGNDADTSNIGRTIYLQVNAEADMKNILTWNSYETWLGSVKEYVVYREIDGAWEGSPIALLSPATNTYTDDVSPYTSSDGKFGYMVVADEGPGDPYHYTDTSTSNIAIALQPPRLYIPNAFVPQGVNSIFIPVNVFVTPENYQFSIYNNWGALIFQTTDTKTGWDGTFKGKLVQQGVYVYVVRFENSGGQMMESAGTVTLIR